MKSKIGSIIILAVLLVDIKIPIGTPITIANKLEIKTRENVSINSVNKPRLYINHKPNAEKIAKPTFLPVIKKAAIIIMIIKTHGGIALNESAVHSIK